MRIKFIILAVIVIFAVMAGLKFTSNQPVTSDAIIANSIDVPKTVAAQGAYLRKAFLRKKSLGFSPYEISLTTEAVGGLQADERFIKNGIIDENWYLGGGQFVGTSNTDFPDKLFYRVGVKESDCARYVDAPEGDTALWKAAFNSNQAILNTVQSLPQAACFQTTDNNRIYYQLVYITTTQ